MTGRRTRPSEEETAGQAGREGVREGRLGGGTGRKGQTDRPGRMAEKKKKRMREK